MGRTVLALVVLGATLVLPGAARAGSGCVFAPTRIAYSGTAWAARREYTTRCRYGLLAADGGWSVKGKAWDALVHGRAGSARTTGAAVKRLLRYHRLGLWKPDRIVYAEQARTAFLQFTSWFAKGYINPDGGWNQRGLARFT